MGDRRPTACAALRKQQKREQGAPATYWFFGGRVREIWQCDEGKSQGEPTEYWTDKHSMRYPHCFRDPMDYGRMWPGLGGHLLGDNGPVGLFGSAHAESWLHALVPDPGTRAGLRVVTFDPESDGSVIDVSWPLQEFKDVKGWDARAVSAACELETGEVLLFGRSESAVTYRVWTPKVSVSDARVLKAEAVAETVTAAFLGYDTLHDEHAKADLPVMRLYHGGKESAFTVSTEGKGCHFTPQPRAAPFLAKSWPVHAA